MPGAPMRTVNWGWLLRGGGAFSSLGFRVYFDLRASGPEFWVLGFELGSIRFLPVFVVSFQKKRC